MYSYIAGYEFKQRVSAIVEGLVSLRTNLEREKRSITAAWAKREKFQDLIMIGVAGLCGDLYGILGKALVEIDGLEAPQLVALAADCGEGPVIGVRATVPLWPAPSIQQLSWTGDSAAPFRSHGWKPNSLKTDNLRLSPHRDTGVFRLQHYHASARYPEIARPRCPAIAFGGRARSRGQTERTTGHTRREPC